MNRYLTAAGVVAVAAIAAGCSAGASSGTAARETSPGASSATGGTGGTSPAVPAVAISGMTAQTAAQRVVADGYLLLINLPATRLDSDAKAHAGRTGEVLGSSILAGLPGPPSVYLSSIAFGGNKGLSKGEVVFQFTARGESAVEAKLVATARKEKGKVVIDHNLVIDDPAG